MTQLLNEIVRPRRTIAVDSSTAFVESAANRLGDTAEVLRGDVLDLPETVVAADLMFARLLLSHLSDPVAAVSLWVSRLSKRGVLMLEEVEIDHHRGAGVRRLPGPTTTNAGR